MSSTKAKAGWTKIRGSVFMRAGRKFLNFRGSIGDLSDVPERRPSELDLPLPDLQEEPPDAEAQTPVTELSPSGNALGLEDLPNTVSPRSSGSLNKLSPRSADLVPRFGHLDTGQDGKTFVVNRSSKRANGRETRRGEERHRKTAQERAAEDSYKKRRAGKIEHEGEPIRKGSIRLGDVVKTVAGAFALEGENDLIEQEERRAALRLQTAKENEKVAYNKSATFFSWSDKLINPAHPFMAVWDIQTTLLLIYTAMLTPFEVAFVTESSILSPLSILNMFVDACFFVDMIFNLFLPYQDEKGRTVRVHRLILARYFRGWFAIDLVSILPFDLIANALQLDAARHLEVLRAIRLLRLAKLLRVVRGMRMFKRWEARMFVNYALMNLLMLFVGLILAAHWLACLFGFIVDMDPESGFGETFPLTSDDCTPVECYQACIYWSVGLITAMGDVNSVKITTSLLRGVYILVMGIAGVGNAYLIGGVVSLLERMNERRSEFYRDMDILNDFLAARRIKDGEAIVDGKIIQGATLCEKLRTYYIFKHSQGNLAESFHRILFSCSAQMQSAIAAKMHADSLLAIPFFRNASRRFVTKVSCAITTQIYAMHEKIFDIQDETDRMFIIECGSVFCKGKVLHQHDTFGEEVFYSQGARGYAAVTLSECVLLSIDRTVLREAVEDSGDGMMRLRMKIISAIIKLQKVARRAAIVTMNRRTFLAGYEVLQQEYSNELLETPGSPIICLWKTKIENCIQCLHEPEAHDGEDRQEHEARLRKYSQVLMLVDYDLKQPISTERLQTMQKVAEDYFDSVEKRAISKSSHRQLIQSSKSPLERFLANPNNFEGENMSHYFVVLSDTHMCTLQSLSTASVTNIMSMGIPYGDARKIKGGMELLVAAGGLDEVEGTSGSTLERSPRSSFGAERLSRRRSKDQRNPSVRRPMMSPDQEELEAFLDDDARFGGVSMRDYIQLLVAKNKMTMSLLLACKETMLQQAGVPLGDAIRIIQACHAIKRSTPKSTQQKEEDRQGKAKQVKIAPSSVASDVLGTYESILESGEESSDADMNTHEHVDILAVARGPD